jgi:hypothetical protein
MRTLAAYLFFVATAVSITTYTVGGLTKGMTDLASERNTQIQQLRNR